jgi:hypothetical protein
MTLLYHIKCSQIRAITHLRVIFDGKDIRNFIGNGGIHVHLPENQIDEVTEIAEALSLKLEEGMLPKVQEEVQNLFSRTFHTLHAK